MAPCGPCARRSVQHASKKCNSRATVSACTCSAPQNGIDCPGWAGMQQICVLDKPLKEVRCCAGGLARSASVPIRRVRIRVPRLAPASPERDADYCGGGNTTVSPKADPNPARGAVRHRTSC